ncbi:MurR/RpiR family transcriptional regulator [Cloacibacillus evryensis]|uniref:MurR/RpiR family transcriptional regulator n=2 Tax=Cloacibacillus evryensis TaxID=508460 RepID=UPI0026DF6839|nr:MurR/RpiR family transcriptional regulator [Cloacibacillus evryensis]
MDKQRKHDIFEKLQYGMKNFSSQQKKLCTFINDNYQEAAFMTVEQLASELQIGVATVIRTTHHLGYDSFKEFTNTLRTLLMKQESTYWRQLKDSWEQDETLKPSVNKLTEVTQQNITNLENSLSPIMLESFSNAIVLLKKARKISILGLRSSRAASYYMYYILDEFIDNVMLTDAIDSAEVFSNIINLTEDDVFVAFSLGGPNYAVRTHEAINYAHARNIPIILITSDLRNPSAAKATYVLLIPSTQGHYSLVPVMNLIDAILANMGSIRNTERMNELERIVTFNNIVS